MHVLVVQIQQLAIILHFKAALYRFKSNFVFS